MFGQEDTNQQSATTTSIPTIDPTASRPEDIALGGDDSTVTSPAPDALPATPLPTSVDPPTSFPLADPAPVNPIPAAATDLEKIKQQALQALTPLVSHLEQSPEEKFRTTMMMLQATDDQSLIPQAYESAQAISDEKARAQALLDIVNEINYFSQQK